MSAARKGERKGRRRRPAAAGRAESEQLCRDDRDSPRAHHALQPPSTTRLAPVTYDDASEARKTTGPTTSPTSAIRPSGIRAAYASTNSGGWSLATPASVSVFTRTPLFAQYV